MNKYSIRYHSRTQAALARRAKQQILPLPTWTFNYPNIPKYELTIALSDQVKRIDNINLHTGLNIIADIKADSEEEAIKTSKNYVETLLNLISFSTLTYCDSAILVSVINIMDDKESLPLSFYVYPFKEQEIVSSINKIDEPTFSAIFKAYGKSSNQARTMRALTWLRKGIGEENLVDQFICYWTGWEVIMGILRRNLRHQIKNPRKWEGIKAILTDNLSFQNLDAIKNARRRLFHGGKEEDELDDKFMREIKSYLEPMRKALVFGIGSIWGLEIVLYQPIANKTPRSIDQAPWSVLKGNIKNLPKSFDELIKKYPSLDAEITNKQFSIDADGGLSITYKVSHHFHGPSGNEWELKEMEQWGKKDSGIQRITLQEMHIDKTKKST